MQTGRDRHDMLIWEVEQLVNTPITDARLIAYRTVHCATSAWHMTDWIYEGLDAERRREWSAGNDGNIIGFKKWARAQQPLLSICRDIAESAKHMVMTRDVSDKISTDRVDWLLDDGRVAVFWALSSETRVYSVRDVMQQVRDWWLQIIDEAGLHFRSVEHRDLHVPSEIEKALIAAFDSRERGVRLPGRKLRRGSINPGSVPARHV